MHTLPASFKARIKSNPETLVLDVRGAPCPLPLLKTKVALRSHPQLFIVTSDPHSQSDLPIFCQKQGLRCKTLASDGLYLFWIAS